MRAILLCCACALFGAAAFGAPVHAYEDNNACALPIAHNADEADRIVEPDIWKEPVLYRIFELAEKVRSKLEREGR